MYLKKRRKDNEENSFSECNQTDNEPSSDAETDTDSESPRKKKKKATFTSHDNQVIRKGCMKFLLSNRSISSETVKVLFKANNELQKLMNTFGLQTLMVKLRSERRRLKNKK